MSNGGKKIVLITTGQPSTNPRLVKEANSLANAGYEVTVLYSYVISWATVFDRQLLSSVKWRFQCIGGSPEKSKELYLVTRIRYKLARMINSYTKGKFLAERAEARAYDELLEAAKRCKADLYIGHNLGTLALAVKAAIHNRAKAGFDFEDYHRGEYSAGDKAGKRVKKLENKYVQKLDYISCSSPLITEAVGRDHPGFKGRKLTSLNCFLIEKANSFEIVRKDDAALKLFWFSQTVGANRGLETILLALKQLANPGISLTLVGRYSDQMQATLLELAGPAATQVFFTGLLPPEKLPSFAGCFDIGMASEVSFPPNRDLCLTNKIFTYISKGLCILASDTAAQKELLDTYPAIGFIYKQNDPSGLARLIERFYQDKNLLASCKKASKSLGETTLNWEKESQKLLRLVNVL